MPVCVCLNVISTYHLNIWFFFPYLLYWFMDKLQSQYTHTQTCTTHTHIHIKSHTHTHTHISHTHTHTQVGAELKNDLSQACTIFGVKEFPRENLLRNRSYVMFSHVIKAQPENMDFLDACLDKNVRLFDYELIRSPPSADGKLGCVCVRCVCVVCVCVYVCVYVCV